MYVDSVETSDEAYMADSFEITIQPFHMLQYCHGVVIITNFLEF